MINFEENIEHLYSMMDKCTICPRKCGVNRNLGQKGLCKTSEKNLLQAAISISRRATYKRKKKGQMQFSFQTALCSVFFVKTIQ